MYHCIHWYVLLPGIYTALHSLFDRSSVCSGFAYCQATSHWLRWKCYSLKQCHKITWVLCSLLWVVQIGFTLGLTIAIQILIRLLFWDCSALLKICMLDSTSMLVIPAPAHTHYPQHFPYKMNCHLNLAQSKTLIRHILNVAHNYNIKEGLRLISINCQY